MTSASEGPDDDVIVITGDDLADQPHGAHAAPEPGDQEPADPELGHPEPADPELGHPELADPELGHPELGHPDLSDQGLHNGQEAGDEPDDDLTPLYGTTSSAGAPTTSEDTAGDQGAGTPAGYENAGGYEVGGPMPQDSGSFAMPGGSLSDRLGTDPEAGTDSVGEPANGAPASGFATTESDRSGLAQGDLAEGGLAHGDLAQDDAVQDDAVQDGLGGGDSGAAESGAGTVLAGPGPVAADSGMISPASHGLVAEPVAGAATAAGDVIPDGPVTTVRPDQNWPEIQSMFVDDPRSAVERAAEVTTSVVDVLAAAAQDRVQALRQGWEADGTGTEELRTALRGYRELANRLSRLSGEL